MDIWTGATILSGQTPDDADPKIVNVLVHKLRKKLPPTIRIDNVWGVGYVLVDSSAKHLPEIGGYCGEDHTSAV